MDLDVGVEVPDLRQVDLPPVQNEDQAISRDIAVPPDLPRPDLPRCTVKVCAAGAEQCNAGGKALVRCDPDGCGWSQAKACPCGCKLGICNGTLCKPSQKLCMVSFIYACQPDGCAWKQDMPCHHPCSCSAGICIKACTPGAKRCGPGNKWYEQCKPDGCGWVSIDNCYCTCNATTGCVQSSCTDSTLKCDATGQNLLKCAPKGCGWYTHMICKCGCAAATCTACP